VAVSQCDQCASHQPPGDTYRPLAEVRRLARDGQRDGWRVTSVITRTALRERAQWAATSTESWSASWSASLQSTSAARRQLMNWPLSSSLSSSALLLKALGGGLRGMASFLSSNAALGASAATRGAGGCSGPSHNLLAASTGRAAARSAPSGSLLGGRAHPAPAAVRAQQP
jgi:hypothetical protein